MCCFHPRFFYFVQWVMRSPFCTFLKTRLQKSTTPHRFLLSCHAVDRMTLPSRAMDFRRSKLRINTLVQRKAGTYLSASSRMTILCLPGGNVTFV